MCRKRFRRAEGFGEKLWAALSSKPLCSCCERTARGAMLRIVDKTGNTVAVRHCALCHALVPLYPPVSDEISRQTTFHRDSWRDETEQSLFTHRDAMLDMLADFTRAGLLPEASRDVRVFDIGAGRGNLTAAAVHAGYDVRSCEPSAALSQTGRDAYGLSADILETDDVHGFVARHAAETGTVSAIFIWHVLEHIERPLQVLEKLAPFLKPDGTIICQGPLLARDHLFPEHRFLHTPANLPWIARAMGLKLLMLQTSARERFVTFVFGMLSHPMPDIRPAAIAAFTDNASDLAKDFMDTQSVMLDIQNGMGKMIDERFEAINEMSREIQNRDSRIKDLESKLNAVEAVDRSTDESDSSPTATQARDRAIQDVKDSRHGKSNHMEDLKHKIRPAVHKIRDGMRFVRWRLGLASDEQVYRYQRATLKGVPTPAPASGLPLISVLAKTDWSAFHNKTGVRVADMQLRATKHTIARLGMPNAIPACQAAPVPLDEVDHAFVEKVIGQNDKVTLSLDIWDTILRRDCHPDETKLRTARALALLGARDNADLRGLHPQDVFQARRLAEASVADDHHEYRFADVAREWVRLLNLSDLDVAAVTAIEAAVEQAATFPDPTVAHVREIWGGRKIAISDFYLPANTLQALLRHNGVDDIAAVYCSSDNLKTKRDGLLFDDVLAREKLSADDVIHVGDNYRADVEQAQSRGLAALHYENKAYLDRTRLFAQRLDCHLAGDVSRHEQALLGLALNVPDYGTTTVDFDVGVPVEALAIPALGMALHCLEETLRSGADDIFFMTREGVFLRELYQTVVAQDVYDLGDYPKGRILEVSRRATFAASLGSFSCLEMMRLWSQYSTQSLQALALSLNAHPDLFATAAANYGIPMDEQIYRPWLDPRVKALFADPAMQATAEIHLAAQRDGLQGYLDNVGFTEPGLAQGTPRMIVDVGWRGTIQDNLAHISNSHIYGAYFGLEHYLNPQPDNTTKTAFLMDRNADASFEIPEFAAIEFLFNATGGTVTGYERGKALRETIAGEEKIVAVNVVGFQKRLVDALRPLAQYVRRHGLVSADLRRLSQAITHAYLVNPCTDIAEAFAGLEHNETFGTGKIDVLSNDPKGDAELDLAQTTDEVHGCLSAHVKHLRWSYAHGARAGMRDRLAALPEQLRLAIPVTYSAAPAVVSATRLGTPRIVFLSPRPLAGSGGHRTIFNFARRLAKLGYDVELRHEERGDARDMAWTDEILLGSRVQTKMEWKGLTQRDSVAVTTIAHSATALNEIFPTAARTMYFVQDHEAEFNPSGDGFLAAQQSYAQGHAHITIGRWLSHLLWNRYGVGAVSAGLGVDRTIYRRLTTADLSERKKQVAFLYQPEKPRRAPSMCIAALSLVKQEMPDVEIAIYGSDKPLSLPFEATNYGLIKDLDTINAIYNSSRVGLCISSTNPSRIPFEMMAAGCVPVDLYRYNNLFDYNDGCGVLAYQSPASLAAAMIHTLDDEAFYKARAEAGFAYMMNRSLDWELDVAANAVGYLLSGADFNELMPPEVTYKTAPFLADACDTPSARAFLDWQMRIAQTTVRTHKLA